MSTICLKCGVATAVGEEMGEMGLPSLDETPRGRGRHRLAARLSSGGDSDTTESFGFLYSGFRAIGLFTHAIESYRDFLQAHSGKAHRLYRWIEEHEDLPAGFEGLEYRYVPYKRPKKAPGFVRARLRFSCAKCKESYESASAEWVRPFERHALAGASVRLFQTRTVEPSEHAIRDAWPFDITLFDDLNVWLAAHVRHGLAIELLTEGVEEEDGGSRQPAGQARASIPVLPVPEPWHPAPTPAEEDERLLGPVSDDALPHLAGLHHRDPAVRGASADAVGRLGESGTLGYLVPALDDPEKDVRVAVSRAIGALSDPRCVRPLGLALLDESLAVRKAARHALKRRGIGEKEALAKARSARGPLDPEAVRAAEKAAGRDRLSRALRDAVHPEHSTRSHAARRLRRLRDVPAAQQMLEALRADCSDSEED